MMLSRIFFWFRVCLIFFTTCLQAQIITTIAGNGTGGFSGDGGLATQADLFGPAGVAIDNAGHLYIADTVNNRIRKVDLTTGIITTVAGSGAGGFSGDGGPAIDATLNTPFSVALDDANNLYISDANNSRVRKVDLTTGIITTFAGTNQPGFNGDNIPANQAELNLPLGLAIISNNLYISDADNNRIRRVNLSTGIITTVAGNGIGGFSGDGGSATSVEINFPEGVAVDGAGNLYIADTGNNRVRKVNLSTGIITTIAGTGTAGFSGDNGFAVNAELNSPVDVAVDNFDHLYISDTNNQRIRQLTLSEGIITTFAGTGFAGFSGDGGPATNAELNDPSGLAVDNFGNLTIADRSNNRIRLVLSPNPTPNPIVTDVSPDTGPSTGGTSVTITGQNFIGVSDVRFGNNSAQMISTSLTSIVVLSPPGSSGTVDITVTAAGGTSLINPSDQFTYFVPINVFPPTRLKAFQVTNPFATQEDIINILKWRPPVQGENPVAYRIYRDASLTKLIATVLSHQRLRFVQHNRKKGKAYTYYLVSVDQFGNLSEAVQVKVK